MIADELRTRFPNASEQFIRVNASVPGALVVAPPPGSSSSPVARKPAKAPGRAVGAKKPKKPRVERTRNGGTWTEAQFWQAVRSGFRRAFRFWRPLQSALKLARVAAPGPRGRKWLFLCAACQKLHLRKQVQVDHLQPCGALTKPEHIAEFLRRLTTERPEDFQVLCKKCHQEKTNKEATANAETKTAGR